jgi:hypothetical protein
MMAAVEASRIYYYVRADLESEHVVRDVEHSFKIKQRVAEALRGRDEAIRDLNDHERSHAKDARAGRP